MSDNVSEVRAVAGWLRDMMAGTGLSLNRAVRAWGLGSKATFYRALNGEMEGEAAGEWLVRYRGVRERLEQEAGCEALFELPTVEVIRDAILGTFRPVAATGRVVFVIGPPGIGKTKAVEILMKKWGERVVRVEAHELWGDRPGNMLLELGGALGVHDVGRSGAERMAGVVGVLRGQRRCVVVDEAHHVGPRILNVIKSLVNMTPGEFVLMGTPPMWVKLNKQAYAEASQLYTNRLGCFVRLELEVGDVEAYFLERFKGRITRGEAGKLARVVHGRAARDGCYAFCREVAGELERLGAGFGPEAVKGAMEGVLDVRS